MKISVSKNYKDIISFCSASSLNVTLVNHTDLEYSIRQMTDIFYMGNEVLQEVCNAEFPKLYIDKLTTLWHVNEGLIDEWPYGPLNWCCKFDANVVVDYPPDFPLESCTLCVGKRRTEWIPGVGEVTSIAPCEQYNSAHNLKLSAILGISLLAFITEY